MPKCTFEHFQTTRTKSVPSGSAAELTSPPWGGEGGGGVNLTIKFNLHLGGEKGSYEFHKISTGSLFLSLSCWCTKVGVKSDFSNISRTASIVVQRDYMQTHTHSDSQLSKQKYTFFRQSRTSLPSRLLCEV